MESKKLADEVIIHGNHAKKTTVYYELPIKINRTIKFIGKYGIPIIMAKNGSLFTAVSPGNQSTEVTFINITFQGRSYKDIHNDRKVFIVLHNSSFHMKRCSFVSVPRPFHLRCNAICNFTINDSKIVSPIVGIKIDSIGRIFSTVVKTEFKGVRKRSKKALVYGEPFFITKGDIFELRLYACNFSYFSAAVLVYAAAEKCIISTEYSRFENNYPANIDDILDEAPSISVVHRTKTIHSGKSLVFLAQSCLFMNNFGQEGSGILLQVKYKKFVGYIKNCTFKDNVALNTGGAVSFYRANIKESALFIIDCKFENNSANSLERDHFIVGHRNKIGSGGALALTTDIFDNTNDKFFNMITVSTCTFTSNSATIIGGTIYTYMAYIVLEYVTIISPKKSLFTMTEGTVLSMTGIEIFAEITGLTIKIEDDYYSQKYAVRLDGRTTIDTTTSLACPVGTVLQFIADDFYRPGIALTYPSFLTLSCIPCDIDQYNLHGSTFSNFHIEHPTCYKCPPGGICQRGILKPVDNYWGIMENKTGNVSFIELLPGYGCARQQCQRYNSCANKRQGTLCSKCMEGYSESMFSSECIRNEDCNKKLFWTVTATMIIFYLLFFIYKKIILCFLKTQLLWFKSLEMGRNIGSAYSLDEDRYRLFSEDTTSETEGATVDNNMNRPNAQSDSLPGLIKIVFYFYQIEALLDVYGGKIEHNIVKGAKSLIQNILNFNFLNSSGSSSCAIDDTTPMIKVIIRGAFVAWILVALILLYIICRILQRKAIRCCKKRSIFTNTKSNFGDRVLAALFEVVLLSYGIITKAITSMLNCKTVGNKQVLYLQGDVQCYQTWQYGLAAAGLAWVVPFCLYINLLPNLIREKQVETKGLFFGCVFPIPVIMYCLIRKVVAKCSTESQQQQVLNSEERNFVNDDGMRREPFENSLNDVEENCNDLISTVQQILCGPFKDEVNSSKFLSWDGVYIFRRLFIVSVFVFVEDATYKLYVLLAGQILILMHHSHVKPYNSKFLNFLESASLGFLVLINGMNLLAVYDFAHGISEVGDKLLLMKLFAWIETVLHLLVPTLIITSLAVLLIVRCFYIIFKILRFSIRAVIRLVIQCCS